jgi:hypothetical protein
MERDSDMTESAPKPTSDEMLRRILAAVEGDQRKRWVEVTCAIVLALATMASAWCAYQSNLWGGVQTFKLAGANKAAREAAKYEIEAQETRLFDGLTTIHFVEQRLAGNKQVEELLLRRFRPEMRAAVTAWLATEPFSRSDAPPSPMKMTQYVQPEIKEAERFHAESATLYDAAERSNQLSDTYVLLTVLFAAVLFCGGISGTLSNDSRRLRWAMQIMALMMFVGISGFLLTMPMCRE